MRFGLSESFSIDVSAIAGRSAGTAPPDPRDLFDHGSHVRYLASRGFNPIELTGDLALFLPHAFAPDVVEDLAGLRDEIGLGYTVHLPLWSVEPSTPLGPVREGSLRALLDAVKAVSAVEPEVYVLHATGALAAEFSRWRLPEPARTALLRVYQRNARQSLRALLAETGIPSRALAIETVEFPFELTLELAEELDLSLCLDTGHVLAGFSGPVDLPDVLGRAIPRLAEVHLHDAPWQGLERTVRYGEDHKALGQGDLDVGDLLDRLSAAAFRGPVILELALEQAQASMDHVRAVRPELLGRER